MAAAAFSSRRGQAIRRGRRAAASQLLRNRGAVVLGLGQNDEVLHARDLIADRLEQGTSDASTKMT